MVREIILNFVIDYLKRHRLSGKVGKYSLRYTSNRAFNTMLNVVLFFLCVFTGESLSLSHCVDCCVNSVGTG